MNIFIMGLGYVGFRLFHHLKPHHSLFASTTTPEKYEAFKQDMEITLLGVDGKLEEMLDRCDALIILVAPKKGGTYEETYLKTAKHILSLLKERKHPLHIIYTSSTSVYEGIENKIVDEETSLAPFSPNGKILHETENIYLSCNQSSILRLGGIYGPERTLLKRAHRFSAQEIDDRFTNHIHVDDVVRGIEYVLTEKLFGVFNLVGEDHPSKKELYSHLCDVEKIPRPYSKQSSEKGVKVSNQKIKKGGFHFMHPHLEI